MPWELRERNGQTCVFKQGEDTPVKGGCHDKREDAVKHLRALFAAEPNTMKYSIVELGEDVLIDDADDPNLKWVKAWRYSTWDHPRYGTVEITPERGQRFKEHFENGSLGREHLINYEHGIDPAKGGKAGGSILDIDPRDDGIYYKVRFTDNALKEIEAGEWRYLSPEYDDWVNPETGVLFEDMPFDLALTNQPFFKGLPPLNFSEVFIEQPKSFAVWSTAFINDLPDSCFLYISPGGKKDGEGKTTPRSLRHFPYKDSNGKIDLPHLRNAIARIPQASIPAGLKDSLQARARRLLSGAGGNPKGGKSVDELLRQFAERLGIELAEDATEEQVLSAAEDLNKTIEPLRKAKVDGERARTFREAFPDEYKEMQKLREGRVETEARAFSENYRRFTIKAGDSEYKSTMGFSEVVIDEIAEIYKKFSDRTTTPVDLRNLLDLIGDKGIVDYSEHGSSRTLTDKQWNEDPKIAFSEAVQAVMTEDDLQYEAAITVAKGKFPELYEAYQRAIPQR